MTEQKSKQEVFIRFPKTSSETGNFLTNSAPDLARAIGKKIYSLPRSRSPKRGRVKELTQPERHNLFIKEN